MLKKNQNLLVIILFITLTSIFQIPKPVSASCVCPCAVGDLSIDCVVSRGTDLTTYISSVMVNPYFNPAQVNIQDTCNMDTRYCQHYKAPIAARFKQDGAPCEVFLDCFVFPTCHCVGVGAGANGVNSKWDASEGKCITCNGLKEGTTNALCADIFGIYASVSNCGSHIGSCYGTGNGKFETACGSVDSGCDEKNVNDQCTTGSGKSGTCNTFGSCVAVTTTTSSSTSTSSSSTTSSTSSTTTSSTTSTTVNTTSSSTSTSSTTSTTIPTSSSSTSTSSSSTTSTKTSSSSTSSSTSTTTGSSSTSTTTGSSSTSTTTGSSSTSTTTGSSSTSSSTSTSSTTSTTIMSTSFSVICGECYVGTKCGCEINRTCSEGSWLIKNKEGTPLQSPIPDIIPPIFVNFTPSATGKVEASATCFNPVYSPPVSKAVVEVKLEMLTCPITCEKYKECVCTVNNCEEGDFEAILGSTILKKEKITSKSYTATLIPEQTGIMNVEADCTKPVKNVQVQVPVSGISSTTTISRNKFMGTKFECTKTTSGFRCSLTYDNTYGNAYLIFFYSKPDGTIVLWSQIYSVGSGTRTQTDDFPCSDNLGEHFVSWTAFSDPDLSNPIPGAWPKPEERAKITC